MDYVNFNKTYKKKKNQNQRNFNENTVFNGPVDKSLYRFCVTAV